MIPDMLCAAKHHILWVWTGKVHQTGNVRSKVMAEDIREARLYIHDNVGLNRIADTSFTEVSWCIGALN